MQWEYRVKKFPQGSTCKQHESYLNELGLEGWELSGVVRRETDYMFFFKRMKD